MTTLVSKITTEILEFNTLVIDRDSKTITIDGKPIPYMLKCKFFVNHFGKWCLKVRFDSEKLPL